MVMGIVQIFAGNSYSQNTRLSLHLKNVSAKTVLSQIEDKSQFYFIYDASVVDVEKEVSIESKNELITKVLDELFEGTNIFYKINDRQIALTNESLPSVNQQQKTVSGQVTDSSGGAFPGVSVVVRGTTTGNITDSNGNYSLSNISEKTTLQFSFMGMKTQQIEVGNKTIIDVILDEESFGIDEFVAVGYGTQKKKDLSGSVVSVKTGDLKNIPTTSIDQALIGHAAGVQVIQNANPGGTATVRIRGVSTTGNNEPLWIIDGIPGSPGYLNPSDLESMDVLKDASATAIYGSRAANGVIIVTTKSGKAGKTKVEFNAYKGFQSIWKKLDMSNSQEFATLANQASINSGWPTNPKWEDPASLSNTDWQDAVTRRGAVQNYSLSVSGGNEKIKSVFSITYNKTEGSIIQSDYNRYTVHLANDFQATKWMKFGSNVTYSRSNSESIPTNNGTSGVLNQAVQMWPDEPVYNSDGTLNVLLQTADSRYYSRISTNPVAQLHYLQNGVDFNGQFQGSFFGEVDILKGLKFKSTIGTSLGNGGNRNFSEKYITDPANWLNNSQNSISWGLNQGQNYTFINALTYAKTIGLHNITLLAGTETNQSSYYFLHTDAWNTPTNNLQTPVSALTTEGRGSGELGRSLSYFGRINYIYNDKYIIQFNTRADASAKFAPENRWGYFPSGSVAWRISEEKFMKSLSFLYDLKLRGSYGLTGNESSISGYPYLSTFGVNRSSIFGTTQKENSSYQANNLGNPNVKWETQKMTDVGFDAAIFNNSLSVTADYYNKITSGLLVKIPVPATLGAPGDIITKNAGEVKNSGFELSVNYNGNAGAFKYNLGANITTLTNKVLSLGGGDIISSVVLANDSYMDSRTSTGHSIGEFYGYVTDGIFQNQAEIYASPTQTGVVPGDRKYKDISGDDGIPDGKINTYDRTYLGSPIPKFFYGINLGASFKGIDFSMVLQGQYGNKILNEMKAQVYNIRSWHGDGLGNVLKVVKDSWNGEGTSNSLPRLTADFIGNNWLGSDFFVEDGSFLRCRTMQLGYTLPILLVKRIELSTARIYINAQNLFTVTNYSGFDPEISNSNPISSGVDWGQYPVSRTFTLGINVQF